MKRWKHMCLCCLAAVFAVFKAGTTAWAGSPEFARTDDEWASLKDNVLQYDELADLIHEYNVTVLKNQLDINDKKKDNRITSDENAQYYRDAASDYRSAITGDNPLTDAQNAVGANQADALADKNSEDITVYQLTYDQEEANLVASAQSYMISYFQQRCKLESEKSNLELLEAVYQSAHTRYSTDMATWTDVLSAAKDMENTQVSIDKLEASSEETRQNLILLLGWNYNDTPEIQDISDEYLARIESMDLEADKASALENNYTLKINKRKLENATADITKSTLERTISSNEQNIITNLVNSYQDVQQSKAAYDQAVVEYELENKNMEAAERKYNNGMLSELDYKKQKNAYDTKNIGVKIARLNLLQAVQSYDNNVNGLVSAGG